LQRQRVGIEIVGTVVPLACPCVNGVASAHVIVRQHSAVCRCKDGRCKTEDGGQEEENVEIQYAGPWLPDCQYDLGTMF
jgi:hypothetical protein